MDKENKLILYKDDEGRVSVNTRFADEDVWLTQAQLVEIYQSSKSNISDRFRRCATQRLHEYIQKGFTMNDERLKNLNGDPDGGDPIRS